MTLGVPTIVAILGVRKAALPDGKPDPMPNVSELMGGSAA